MAKQSSVKTPVKAREPAKVPTEEMKKLTGLVKVEREFLQRLKARGKVAKLPDLFEGFTPLWAVNAAARAVEAGRAERDREGVYTLTSAGIVWLGEDEYDALDAVDRDYLRRWAKH